MILWHATWPSRLDSIAEAGLRPSQWDGVIYTCTDPNWSATFLAMRGMFEQLEGFDTVTLPDGTEHRIPKVIVHDRLVLLGFDVDEDDPRLGRGVDHNPDAFDGCEVYTWAETVPFDRLTVQEMAPV